jgi:3-methylcrotonyl-CoA carboxylase alpha subunit
MGAAAVALATAAGYSNAGTVEFLLDGHGDTAHFYFLEMNARLQVEHPITEAVTGVDLVRAQIEVAAGRPVPWTQERLSQRGHAIEVRVCAEDPRQGFLPQAGTLALYREPSMPGVRVDAGVTEGSDVSVHYDSLLAKLVAWGETREAARQRARLALAHYPILGIRTNVPLLMRLLEHERFVAGDLDTHFLQTEAAALIPTGDTPSADARAVAALARHGASSTAAAPDGSTDPWTSLGGRRV